MQIRDWLYVEDHCKAIDKIIRDGKIGETYCIGGNSEIPNIEIAKTILSLLGKDDSYIEYVKDRPGHDKRYAIDFLKIKNELGWQPQVSFKEGIKKTIEWFKKNEQWWRNAKSGEYQKYYNEQYDLK